MKIFLTNDDGIHAEGIRILAEVLQKAGHQIFIVAPDRERSATGHSITILNRYALMKLKYLIILLPIKLQVLQRIV